MRMFGKHLYANEMASPYSLLVPPLLLLPTPHPQIAKEKQTERPVQKSVRIINFAGNECYVLQIVKIKGAIKKGLSACVQQ